MPQNVHVDVQTPTPWRVPQALGHHLFTLTSDTTAMALVSRFRRSWDSRGSRPASPSSFSRSQTPCSSRDFTCTVTGSVDFRRPSNYYVAYPNTTILITKVIKFRCYFVSTAMPP